MSFYIYSAHLKASPGGANEQLRLAGVETIRADADSLPDGTHVIYAGDLNFYESGEPGYLEFLTDGPGQATDPLGTGSWEGEPHAIKHSQSPRDNGSNFCGLAPGGMDDRFDFQLVTDEWLDGDGLDLIPGTYRSLGNDGRHFDIAINDGDNFYYPDDVPRSNALADALHDASDHLPVVVDYVVSCPADLDLDGDVGITDFLALLAAWGPNPGHPADLDGDGTVGITDFLDLLAAWGPCVPLPP